MNIDNFIKSVNDSVSIEKIEKKRLIRLCKLLSLNAPLLMIFNEMESTCKVLKNSKKFKKHIERIDDTKVLMDRIEERMVNFSIDDQMTMREIFRVKIANALYKNKIKTIFDLRHFTFEKLLNIKNIGYRFAREIEWRLNVLGHSLESNLLNRPIKYIDGKGWEFE